MRPLSVVYQKPPENQLAGSGGNACVALNCKDRFRASHRLAPTVCSDHITIAGYYRGIRDKALGAQQSETSLILSLGWNKQGG